MCVCVVECDNEDVESFEVASSSSRRRWERGEGEGRERADVRFTEQRYAHVDYRCEETRNEWATVALESRKRRYACRISIGEKREKRKRDEKSGPRLPFGRDKKIGESGPQLPDL